MMNRKLMTVWAGVALATSVPSWGQDAAAPAKPEAAAPAKPAAAVPAEAAVPAPPPAPALPAGVAAPRQKGAAAVNPERMKDMQKLQGLRREYHTTRRTVTEKQQTLLNNPDVSKQVTEIDEQIRKLQDQIRKLEDGKPEVYRKADASLQAEYDKMAETEKQIQELEKKLYPARPAPGVPPALPKPPAAPAPAAAAAPAPAAAAPDAVPAPAPAAKAADGK